VVPECLEEIRPLAALHPVPDPPRPPLNGGPGLEPSLQNLADAARFGPKNPRPYLDVISRQRPALVDLREQTAVLSLDDPFNESIEAGREEPELPAGYPLEQDLEDDLVSSDYVAGKRVEEQSRPVGIPKSVHRPVVVLLVLYSPQEVSCCAEQGSDGALGSNSRFGPREGLSQ
jgi:hypothetical protein